MYSVLIASICIIMTISQKGRLIRLLIDSFCIYLLFVPIASIHIYLHVFCADASICIIMTISQQGRLLRVLIDSFCIYLRVFVLIAAICIYLHVFCADRIYLHYCDHFTARAAASTAD